MDYYFEKRKTEFTGGIRDTLDFGAHLHEHIELGYLKNGSADLYIEDTCYPLKENDFFVVFPNQIHRYENSRNVVVFMLIFQPEMIPEFRKLFSNSVPETPVISPSDSLKRIADIFLNEYENISEKTLHGFLLTLSGMMFENMKFESREKYNISTVKNILIYCNQHYTEPISISDVSAALHISRYHIAHIFNQKLNTTFSEYIAKQRVRYACSLLKDTDLSISEIALASGFGSLRTFNRTFAKYIDITPKKMRL